MISSLKNSFSFQKHCCIYFFDGDGRFENAQRIKWPIGAFLIIWWRLMMNFKECKKQKTMQRTKIKKVNNTDIRLRTKQNFFVDLVFQKESKENEIISFISFLFSCILDLFISINVPAGDLVRWFLFWIYYNSYVLMFYRRTLSIYYYYYYCFWLCGLSRDQIIISSYFFFLIFLNNKLN